MPEEINRVLTDQIANLLYTTERSAQLNLAKEGIDGNRVHFVGNVMIDSLFAARPNAVAPAETLRQSGATPDFIESPTGYGVVTLHRPSNVDDAETLRQLLTTLSMVAERLPLVFCGDDLAHHAASLVKKMRWPNNAASRTASATASDAMPSLPVAAGAPCPATAASNWRTDST